MPMEKPSLDIPCAFVLRRYGLRHRTSVLPSRTTGRPPRRLARIPIVGRSFCLQRRSIGRERLARLARIKVTVSVWATEYVCHPRSRLHDAEEIAECFRRYLEQLSI